MELTKVLCNNSKLKNKFCTIIVEKIEGNKTFLSMLKNQITSNVLFFEETAEATSSTSLFDLNDIL